MIIGLGIDIVSIERIDLLLKKYGNRFERRFFSDNEIEMSDKISKNSYYAKRFAAKEAFLKATGTGLTGGFAWREIETLNHRNGTPYINLLRESKEVFCRTKGEVRIHISLSDEKTHAVACVIIETIDCRDKLQSTAT